MTQPDSERVTYFAETDYRNRRQRFGIKRDDRARHMYVIGKTGMGKSTLLENMAIQDIQNGEGLAFIDPHGSAAEALLEYVPEERIKDVLYFAPHDLNYPISFNVMEDVDDDKRHLVVSGLMSTFEKIWVDMWSARMAYILQNTLLALLEYPGATLLGVNRMYVDKTFRDEVVSHVTDPAVKSFWNEEFAKYTDRFAAEATPAIQNKVGQFVSNPMIRNIISQPESSFNLREILDKKKIFIVNLSKGQVGESNANLLGSMLVTKLYLAALSRADKSRAELVELPNFYLYVDEFQSFANKSFADILSEARKYKLNLTIAHQYIEQMSEEVRAAVFGNIGTMITFRIGAYDAEIFEKEFAPEFSAEDLVNLGRFQVYLKLMVDGITSAPFSARTLPPIEPPATPNRDRVIAHSRETYAQPRAEVEDTIKTWHEVAATKEEEAHKRRSAKGQSSDSKQRSSRKKESSETMSLDRVKEQAKKQQEKQQRKKRKKKGPSEENIAELREALSKALGPDAVPNKGDSDQTKTQQKEQQKKESKPDDSKQKQQDTQPKEVPEHVLKKLLKLEDEDALHTSS